jgi:LytTr DNA-binding domain
MPYRLEKWRVQPYSLLMTPLKIPGSDRTNLWNVLLFFVVAPIIVACVETFLQLSMVVDGDIGTSLGFALLFTIPGTFFAWASTWLIARLPRAERLPLPLLLAIGFMVSLLVFRPYNRFIYDLIPVAAPNVKLVPTSVGQEILRFLFVNVPGVIIWTGLNLLFIAKLNFPVYGKPRVEPLIETSETTPLPAFCQAAGISALSDLWAISAEEHYLRLQGAFGTRMIRHSFSAALEQLPRDAGLRVHRSHWVAFGRVTRVEAGKASQLLLDDGTMVPVSGRYHQAVLLTEGRLLKG